MPDDSSLPESDYAELERALERSRAALGPAEGHGLICGLLSVPSPPPEDVWIEEIFGEYDPDDLLARECRDWLHATLEEARCRLAAPDFDFRLLLPEEGRSLLERTRALGEWCDGYLAGLSLGGLSDLDALSAEAREAVEDFVRIARIEPEASESDEAESDFAELTEYVRMAVILLHDELHGRPAPPRGPAALH